MERLSENSVATVYRRYKATAPGLDLGEVRSLERLLEDGDVACRS